MDMNSVTGDDMMSVPVPDKMDGGRDVPVACPFYGISEEEALGKDFHLLKVICSSREEAEELLGILPETERFVVRYRKTPQDSEDMVKTVQKIEAMEEKKKKFLEERSVRNFSAKTIGCKKCGSQLAKEFLKDDTCPLCGNDLRSQSTLDTLAQMDGSLQELRDELFALTVLNKVVNGGIVYLVHAVSLE